MKSPLHHLKHPEGLFEHFHNNIHHAFVVFGLAILGMLRGASNILTHTSANRIWGGFLTSDFRSQNPSNANIMYALFGDGTPGSTAYTRTWDSSCVPGTITPLSSLTSLTAASNTIYIVNSGNYTLFNDIIFSGVTCSALVATGNVTINAGSHSIVVNNSNRIIFDNLKEQGNSSSSIGFTSANSSNLSINDLEILNNQYGLSLSTGSYSISNSRIFNNSYGIYGSSGNSKLSLNDSLIYNNTYGIQHNNIIVNNSQIYNNDYGMNGSLIQANTSIFYNNRYRGVASNGSIITNNISLYNNGGTGIYANTITYYGTLKFFGNDADTNSGALLPGSTPPVSSRSNGVLNTGSATMDYDRMTNPQNGNNFFFINGTGRTNLRGTHTFTNIRPIRYIFGGNILRQGVPIKYNGTGLVEYGNDGADFVSTRYIAEPDSTLPMIQQTLVNQYFGSGSLYTQNRQTNGCSLSAFQIVTLNPDNFSGTYNLQDHTLYILTGGEYRLGPLVGSFQNTTNFFNFNGNCIAVIGNGNTSITKYAGAINMFYANNKRNLIIDNVSIDGTYSSSFGGAGAASIGINFDGINNNSTINNVQTYNTSLYGIYLGLGSHHNTIMNSQSFNNKSAGIHLYYSSNYNVINNIQTYNNSGYGIWFANGSNRNSINNFQAYNNTVGIFGDLTTQENVINRAVIYNNSDAGISLKNSSDNIFNDVRIYNNSKGIKTLYSSLGNKYYGELKIYNNISGNLDGTTSNDTYLSAGAAGLFPYGGNLNTGNTTISCLNATNPMLSGNGGALQNSSCSTTGYVPSFVTSYTTSINYAFGLNIYKQSIPVRYDVGNALIQLASQYDPAKYIAEAFAFRDTTPEGVNFIGSGAAQMNTRYTTNVYTASVINTVISGILFFIPNTTSGYLIINGINSGLTGNINNGDTIQISLLTNTGYNQTITGSITLGTVTTGFTITTRGPSQMPTSGSFAFANLTSVPLNTFTGSMTTIAGLETGVLASITFSPTITSGRLEIYSGTAFVSSGTTGLLVYNGNQVKAIAQSSTGYSQTITGYITIGLGTGTFSITTRGILSQTPTSGSFAFANLTSVPLNTFTGSMTTIAGLETGVLASITFSPTITSGRLEIYSGTAFVSSGTTGLLVYNGNQVKAIAQSSTGYSQTITGYITIGLGTGTFSITTRGNDFTPPTSPTVVYPISGEEMFFITFEWNASIDTGSGIQGYMYQIADNTSFNDIVNSGFILTTGTLGSPNTGFYATNHTYYRRIKAKDRDGNYSARSNIGQLVVIHSNNRDFSGKNNANLRTYYDSNELTLDGLKSGISIRASVDGNGIIYKNGTDKGTGTFVQNGDNIFVSLRSSNSYNSTIASMLTIANRTLKYSVRTIQDSNGACTLSNDDKTTIQTIFTSLVANYSGDANKYDEFLNTMQSMLADQVDFTNDCNLQYLEDLINLEINGGGTIDTGSHIAPNCKEYAINYDTTRSGYTSPTLTTTIFFANRDSIIRYIDTKNPGDCHINTYTTSSWVFTNTDPSRHIAPNGKIYLITSDAQGFTSSDFKTKKYFSTIDLLRSYINGKNIPQDIRNHQVDTTFTPQTYVAPNGKSYTIYRTDRGYMSYKLLKVKYFYTLADIQYFINSNNKK